VAKTRKSAKKASTKKASGAKKAAGGKKKARKSPSPKELDLRPLKKQLRAHVAKLSAAPTAKEVRVQNAIANLQRLHDELNQDCEPTMTIPLA
jgi:hypothetical protein